MSIALDNATFSAVVPRLLRSDQPPSRKKLRPINFSLFRRRTSTLGCLVAVVALLSCGAAIAQGDSATDPSEELSEPDDDKVETSSPTTDETALPEETRQLGVDKKATSPPTADERESARLYLTNEERRKVGRKYSLTSWLTAAALIELEGQSQAFRSTESNSKDRLADTTTSAQAEFIAATPWRNAKAEIVLEYDSTANRIVADEAFLGVEVEDWEIEAGRLYTPLGIYISHFASGPLLEFAESRADGLMLSYTPSDRLEFKLMGYRGEARPANDGSEKLDWAASIEARLGGGWLLGLSYQSDLADSREALLEDSGSRYLKRVGAAGGYAVWTTADFDLTFEVIGALRPFDELEDDRNQPIAWNAEFAHFVHPRFDWALRWEGSRELVDAPDRRVGLALIWRPVEQASLTVEYLYGWFSGSLATNEEGEPYESTYQIGAKLSVAF
ncbi:MAG TPA: hypothetical protein PKY50_16460 [Candidatus Competibacter sp.]|nr:hypothetical protein [Candidatus Competibacter sp.]